MYLFIPERDTWKFKRSSKMIIKKQDATNGTRKMLAVAVRQVFKK